MAIPFASADAECVSVHDQNKCAIKNCYGCFRKSKGFQAIFADVADVSPCGTYRVLWASVDVPDALLSMAKHRNQEHELGVGCVVCYKYCYSDQYEGVGSQWSKFRCRPYSKSQFRQHTAKGSLHAKALAYHFGLSLTVAKIPRSIGVKYGFGDHVPSLKHWKMFLVVLLKTTSSIFFANLARDVVSDDSDESLSRESRLDCRVCLDLSVENFAPQKSEWHLPDSATQEEVLAFFYDYGQDAIDMHHSSMSTPVAEVGQSSTLEKDTRPFQCCICRQGCVNGSVPCGFPNCTCKICNICYVGSGQNGFEDECDCHWLTGDSIKNQAGVDDVCIDTVDQATTVHPRFRALSGHVDVSEDVGRSCVPRRVHIKRNGIDNTFKLKIQEIEKINGEDIKLKKIRRVHIKRNGLDNTFRKTSGGSTVQVKDALKKYASTKLADLQIPFPLTDANRHFGD